MKSIRWDRRSKSFVFPGSETSERTADFPVESASDISLSSLRRALASQASIPTSSVASLPPPKQYQNIRNVHELMEYQEESLTGSAAEIVFHGDGTVIHGLGTTNDALFFHLTEEGHLRAHFYVEDAAVSDEGIVVKTIGRLFSKPLDLIQLLYYDERNIDDIPAWTIELACDPRGRTVGFIWHAYRALCFSLTASSKDLAGSAESVRLALRLGRPDSLIGAAECSWLEAKSEDYHLTSPEEKIKLAQDIARFANAEGGLIILGLRTSRFNGLDIIARVTPLPMPPRPVARYRNTIDTHVYPLVRGLDILSVPYDTGELLAISIPSQPEDSKPFVVHGNLGSITGNKVRGQFVSVVERRGDGAEYLSGPAIHGLLTARRIQAD
jgi:hypothetical protein